jgi:hypothetical protein
MSVNLQLVPGSLSTECYPSSPQVLYNEMFEKGVAILGDITGILIQSSAPDPEDRDKAWVKLTAPGGPPTSSRPLVWYNGQWVARHPYDPGDPIRLIWVGDPADLDTFDGGSAGTVSDISGAFWEIDSEFAGRVPIGVGTVPDQTTVVAVDTNTGSGQATLSSANIPSHTHEIGVESSDVSSDSQQGQLRDASGDVTWISTWDQTAVGVTRAWGGSAVDQSTTPFNVLPAGRGVYFIKRTARIFFTT